MQGALARCITCGKEYKVCPHCGDASWRKTACSPDCWSISQAINQHFYHLIDAHEAVNVLQRHNYNKIPLREETQRQISQIFAEDAALRRAARKERKVAPAELSVEIETNNEQDA